LWDAADGRCIHTFTEAKGFGQHLEFHPSGSCIGVGTSDGKIKVFDIRAMKLQQYYATHEAAVTRISFHASGSYLVSSSQDKTVRLHNLLTVKPLCTLHGHEKAVHSVAFTPQGEYFGSGGGDGRIFVWKANLDIENVGSAAKQSQKSVQKELSFDEPPVLSMKNTNKENTDPVQSIEKGLSSASISAPPNSSDNSDIKKELRKISQQFGEMSRKMDTLTETVLYMEKRLSLLEEQVKVISK